MVFETILRGSEFLFWILQKCSLDISLSIHKVGNFKKKTIDIKNKKFEELYCWVLDDVNQPPAKCHRRQKPEAVWRTLLNNIFDKVWFGFFV